MTPKLINEKTAKNSEWASAIRKRTSPVEKKSEPAKPPKKRGGKKANSRGPPRVLRTLPGRAAAAKPGGRTADPIAATRRYSTRGAADRSAAAEIDPMLSDDDSEACVLVAEVLKPSQRSKKAKPLTIRKDSKEGRKTTDEGDSNSRAPLRRKSSSARVEAAKESQASSPKKRACKAEPSTPVKESVSRSVSRKRTNKCDEEASSKEGESVSSASNRQGARKKVAKSAEKSITVASSNKGADVGKIEESNSENESVKEMSVRKKVNKNTRKSRLSSSNQSVETNKSETSDLSKESMAANTKASLRKKGTNDLSSLSSQAVDVLKNELPHTDKGSLRKTLSNTSNSNKKSPAPNKILKNADQQPIRSNSKKIKDSDRFLVSVRMKRLSKDLSDAASTHETTLESKDKKQESPLKLEKDESPKNEQLLAAKSLLELQKACLTRNSSLMKKPMSNLDSDIPNKTKKHASDLPIDVVIKQELLSDSECDANASEAVIKHQYPTKLRQSKRPSKPTEKLKQMAHNLTRKSDVSSAQTIKNSNISETVKKHLSSTNTKSRRKSISFDAKPDTPSEILPEVEKDSCIMETLSKAALKKSSQLQRPRLSSQEKRIEAEISEGLSRRSSQDTLKVSKALEATNEAESVTKESDAVKKIGKKTERKIQIVPKKRILARRCSRNSEPEPQVVLRKLPDVYVWGKGVDLKTAMKDHFNDEKDDSRKPPVLVCMRDEVITDTSEDRPIKEEPLSIRRVGETGTQLINRASCDSNDSERQLVIDLDRRVSTEERAPDLSAESDSTPKKEAPEPPGEEPPPPNLLDDSMPDPSEFQDLSRFTRKLSAILAEENLDMEVPEDHDSILRALLLNSSDTPSSTQDSQDSGISIEPHDVPRNSIANFESEEKYSLKSSQIVNTKNIENESYEELVIRYEEGFHKLKRFQRMAEQKLYEYSALVMYLRTEGRNLNAFHRYMRRRKGLDPAEHPLELELEPAHGPHSGFHWNGPGHNVSAPTSQQRIHLPYQLPLGAEVKVEASEKMPKPVDSAPEKQAIDMRIVNNTSSSFPDRVRAPEGSSSSTSASGVTLLQRALTKPSTSKQDIAKPIHSAMSIKSELKEEMPVNMSSSSSSSPSSVSTLNLSNKKEKDELGEKRRSGRPSFPLWRGVVHSIPSATAAEYARDTIEIKRSPSSDSQSYMIAAPPVPLSVASSADPTRPQENPDRKALRAAFPTRQDEERRYSSFQASPFPEGGGGGGAKTPRVACMGCGVYKLNMYVCSGCRKEWYCSQQCQNLRWAEHSRNCAQRVFDSFPEQSYPKF